MVDQVRLLCVSLWLATETHDGSGFLKNEQVWLIFGAAFAREFFFGLDD